MHHADLVGAFHELDGRGRFTDLFLARIDASPGRFGFDRDLRPARHELDAELLVQAEAGNIDDAAVRQEPLGTHADTVLAGQQLDRTERCGPYLALVDRHSGFGGRVRDDGHVPGQLAHLDIDDDILFVANLEVAGNVEIALLRYLHGVAALAQQHAVTKRQAEPAAADAERIGLAGCHLELDRLGCEQEKRGGNQQYQGAANDPAQDPVVRTVRAYRGRFGRAPERGRRNGLFGRLVARGIRFGRPGDVSAVFEPNLQRQLRVVEVHANAAAEVTELVPVMQPAACGQRLAVDRHRVVAPYRLHEGNVVEDVEHHHGRGPGSGQTQLAVAACADANRQALRVYPPFAFDVPDE